MILSPSKFELARVNCTNINESWGKYKSTLETTSMMTKNCSRPFSNRVKFLKSLLDIKTSSFYRSTGTPHCAITRNLMLPLRSRKSPKFSHHSIFQWKKPKSRITTETLDHAITHFFFKSHHVTQEKSPIMQTAWRAI